MTQKRDAKEPDDLGGDELTRLRRKSYQGSSEEKLRQFAEENSAPAFFRMLAELSAESDEILKGLHLPTIRQKIGIDPEGRWVPYENALDPATGQRLPGYGSSTGAHFVLQTTDPFSEAWYAAQIGELCWAISAAPEQPVLQQIFQLGCWIEDRSWRLRYKRSILRGRSVRKGAQYGGEARAAAINPNTQRVLREIDALLTSKPKLSVKRAAELVFEKKGIGSSANANRQLWYTHKRRKL
jgi:hypothetical protein